MITRHFCRVVVYAKYVIYVKYSLCSLFVFTLFGRRYSRFNMNEKFHGSVFFFT